jgi:hypothetical protein
MYGSQMTILGGDFLAASRQSHSAMGNYPFAVNNESLQIMDS